jgi:hypothetical protein
VSLANNRTRCDGCKVIANRVGRALEFDPKSETFVNDDEANALLSRDYRSEFKVPSLV